MTAPLISIRGLTKAYGTFTVLHGIDLNIAEGEVVCVIGPSGSGKSTLIRCINHLEAFAPESRITVDGIRVEPGPALAKVRAEVGMVFQSFNLFPHMTVLKNVMLAPMRVRGTSETEAGRKARELLARVGISEQADKFPGQLSGGQQQRVAIARALCHGAARCMLFDEPTSALDPEMVKRGARHHASSLAEDPASPCSCVTHEMGFARQVADRVIFMDGGRLVESGTPTEIFDAPQHERTRGFLRAVLNH
jgi:polar amino acid transport system ATP-binding protein/general L-amino acid transport system ATP-binding protein